MAPASLATVFGRDLARGVIVGQLKSDGSLPDEIDGVSVEWEGRPAQLVYVSPTQINFLVPAQALVGEAIVAVKRKDSAVVQTGIARVKLSAPGLFTLECLRADRAAAQNGVTYELEPFRATTPNNPGDDKRTRLSIYGTGFRFTSNPTRSSAQSNVASAVTVSVTDASGNTSNLLTEYAGPSPIFAGLDQVNVILPYSLDNAGLLKICLSATGEQSNCVTVLSASKLPVAGEPGRYMITRVAGDGGPGYRGDSQDALSAKLTSPVAVAIDRRLNLYVADAGNRVIRRVGVNGMITTYAGTGEAGSEGDEGPARNARFRSIAGLVIDELDNLYVVDSEDHRVRRIDSNGIVHAFAGTGTVGFGGDRGQARLAQLSSPSAIAIDSFGGILIADSANHRVRKVTRDGLIQTIAGTGEAGFSGDGYPAYQAKLNHPDSVAVTAEGVVFVADGKNYRIRRIARDGTIRTLAGTGEPGSSGEACDASLAQLKFPVRLALDKSGRLFIADSSNQRLRAIDSNCTINPIAGVGREGYSGDGGAALEAMLDAPLGLSVSPLGEVFFADSDNNRVRKLMYVTGACGDVAEISISPRFLAPGQSATGYVRLQCPVNQDVHITLSAGDTCVSIPAAVTLRAGVSSVSFPVSLVSACAGSDVKVEARDGRNTVEAIIGISDPGDGSDGGSGGGGIGGNPPSPALTVTVGAVVGGQTVTGRVETAEPAPASGLSISLSSNHSAAQVASGLTITEGQTGAEFLVNTSPVTTPTAATVTASGGGASGQGNVLVQPNGSSGTPGPTLDALKSLTVSPASVTGGQGATGTVVLNFPAPAGGALVYLSSNHSAASVPATVVVPGGSSTATFPVGTKTVPASTPTTITASSANSKNAPLTITPQGGSAGLGSVTINPSIVTGGQGATGTITLTSPAPAGGVTVALTSNNPSVTVPTTVVVPAGATSMSFPVTTSPVTSNTSTTITAVAPGSSPVTTQVNVNPAGAGTGTISSLTLSPASVSGGSASTGTVQLSVPAGTGGVLVTLGSNSGSASVPASITIPQGASSGTFPVSTSPVVAATTAMITATSANSASASLSITAAAPGSANISSLTLSPATITGGSPSTGTVQLAAPAPAGGVLVNLGSNSASAGVPASITIAQGASSGTFTVTTTSVGSQTTATVTATSANSASGNLTINASGPGTGTISSLTLSPASVTGGSPSTGTVQLSAPAGVGGVLVNLGSNSPSVTVPASITIPQGASSGTFTVTTTAVSSPAAATITATSANSTTASLTLSASGAGQGTISSLTLSPASVVSGSPSTGTVQLSTPASGGGVLVNLSSNNAAATVPASIVIPQGASSGTFTVTTTSVGSSATASITATSANSTSANLTLTPPGPGTANISSVSFAPSAVTGGTPSTGTVQLSAPAGAGGVLVNLGSNNASATVPASITIAQGASSGTFSVTTSSVGAQVVAAISATSANSTSANLTINPSGPGTGTISSLTLSPTTVTGGAASTGTVQLSAPAGAGGVLVNLASNSASATVPASITIAQGASSGTFSVTTSSVGAQAVAAISATSANSTSANLTINPSGPGTGTISSLTLSPTSLTGGASSTGTVQLSAPAGAGGVLVNLGSNSASAAVPASITIAQGASSGTFSVTTSSVGAQVVAAISATSANSASANLTINPSGPGTGTISSLTLSPTTVTGGASSTGTVQLSAPAGAGGVLVNLGSNSASATIPASITIAQGASSGTFSVTTSSVGAQVVAAISATSANSTSANLTINPSGPGTGTISSLTLSPTAVTGGASSTGTVQLSAPAGVGGVLVNLGSNSASASVPASITVPQGASSGTFSVSTSSVGAQAVAAISATSANLTSANLTINPSVVCANSLVLNVNITNLISGAGTLTATVTLTGPSPSGGAQVQLLRSGVNIGTINIPQGQTSGSVSLQIANLLTLVGSTVEAVVNGCPAVNATIALGAPITGTIANLTLSPSTATAGANVTGTVTLGAPAGSNGVLVNLLSNNQTAAAVSGTVVVPAGSLSATFPVNTVNTSPSVVTVTITASSGASSRGAQLTINSSNPCVDSLSLNANITNLVTGAGVLNALVTLTGPAPAGGTTVPLLVGATQVGQVAIPANQSSASASVLVANLPTLLGSVLRAVTGPCPGATATISATVPGIANVNLPVGLTFGQSGNATVTLSAAAPAGGAVLQLSKTTGVAGLAAGLLNSLLGSVVLPATVTVPAGQVSATFPVQTSALGGVLNTALALLGVNNVGYTVQSTLQTAFTPSSWSGPLLVAR